MNTSIPIRMFAIAVALAGTTPCPAQSLTCTRGPFLQNTTTNGVQIIWRTAAPASTFVQYGAGTNLDNVFTNASLVTNHVVTLTGLAADTRYSYRAGGDTGTGSLLATTAVFRTFKAAGSLSFLVVGDTFLSPGTLTSAMRRAEADLVLHLGDVVGGGYDDSEFDDRFFQPFQAYVQSTPFYFALGNHDKGNSSAPGLAWQGAFHLPTNSWDGTEFFYSFDHGDAHFAVLLFTEGNSPIWLPYPPYPGSPQYRWLTNDLARSSKPWKFIFGHYPLASVGAYAHFDNSLVPLAGQFGLTMAFGSHDHDLQRFAPTNGLHHVVSGGGGATLYSYNTYRPTEPSFAQFWARFHFLRVAITNSTLTIEAIDQDGQVFDGMTVQQTLPAREIHDAAWHSPTIESGPANDGDGNVTNQTFDFIGPPLYPRAGQFSNLGRVYVNNDAACSPGARPTPVRRPGRSGGRRGGRTNEGRSERSRTRTGRAGRRARACGSSGSPSRRRGARAGSRSRTSPDTPASERGGSPPGWA